MESERILIPLHPKPDGDSFGSCAAMKYVLEREGKKVTVISKDSLSENLKEFSFAREVLFGKGIEDIDLSEFDILLLLDHGSSLTCCPEKDIRKIAGDLEIINIDHHPTNESYGNINYVNSQSPYGRCY
ncbi:MAG: DHH family phosphoesterase [Nanoarchaeota archaeon]|nr:DHH family phosphoesterase [Nanoarchaeota archaeon]